MKYKFWYRHLFLFCVAGLLLQGLIYIPAFLLESWLELVPILLLLAFGYDYKIILNEDHLEVKSFFLWFANDRITYDNIDIEGSFLPFYLKVYSTKRKKDMNVLVYGLRKKLIVDLASRIEAFKNNDHDVCTTATP